MLRGICLNFGAHRAFTDPNVLPDEIRRSELLDARAKKDDLCRRRPARHYRYVAIQHDSFLITVVKCDVEQMRITLLILVAGVLPLFWGWSVHWIMSRLWPQNRPGSRKPSANSPSSPPLDYQI
jgi:hypothetical protein